jgi:hypothetical protein
MVIGILIPIAIIIGIGVILMKLFIIGFWFLGRGDHNFFLCVSSQSKLLDH